MAINEFDYVPQQRVIDTYVPLPYQEINHALAVDQNKYDVNEAQNEENEDNFLKVMSLERDTAHRDEILKRYRQEMADKYDAVKGDYGQLGSFVKSQSRKIKSDLAYGALGTIHNNYLARQRDLEEIDNNKDLTHDQKQYLKQAAYDNYGGVQRELGQGETYNRYSGIPGAKYINREKLAEYLGKDYKANKIKTGVWSEGADGKIYKKTSYGKEEVTEREIYEGVMPTLQSHPELTAYMRQEAASKFYGNPDATEDDINDYINQQYHTATSRVAKKYGYKQEEFDTDIKWKPKYAYDEEKGLGDYEPKYTPGANGAVFTNANVQNLMPSLQTTDGKLQTKAYKIWDDKSGTYKDVDQMTWLRDKRSGGVHPKHVAYADADPLKVYASDPKVKDLVNKRLKADGLKTPSAEYIKQTVADYQKAIKDTQNVTLPGDKINPKQAAIYTDLLERSKSSDLYTVQGYGNLTITELAEKLGVAPEDIKIKPNLIHYESIDPNRKGGMVEATLAVKGKGYIPAMVPLNDNFSAETSLISEIGQNSVYKGDDTYTDANPYVLASEDDQGNPVNTVITTSTVPKKNYTQGKEYPFKTSVTVKDVDANGNVIPGSEEEMPYEVFKSRMAQKAKERLKNVSNSGGQTSATTDIKQHYDASDEE
jgi:hypothetical protein